MSVGGITAGGTVHRLPPGASAAAAPVLRPLPGGGGRLLVGMLGGGALPAWVLPGAAMPARAWVLVPGAEGALLLGGDALADSLPPGATPVPAPDYPPPPIRLAQTAKGPSSEAAEEAVPGAVPVARGRGGVRLALAGGPMDIPFEALVRLLPMPPLHPAPGAPPAARGLAWTEAGAVLVLHAGEAALLAVILSGGRLLGLPCRGAAPVPGAAVLPPALSDPALLAAAPLSRPALPEPAAPTRLLLLFRAAGAAFALPLEEVAAVLPPERPRNPGAGGMAGIAAHRGDVLPVLDAGLRLGRGPVLTGGPAPMLRLAGARPAALAVSSVQGLRAVPSADIVPVDGGGMVAAVARLDGDAIAVLRAPSLLAPLGRGAAP